MAWEGVSYSKSSAYIIQCPSFSASENWVVIWNSGWEFLEVCHHPNRFGDHGHCESGDMFLDCHVASPGHLFKEL